MSAPTMNPIELDELDDELDDAQICECHCGRDGDAKHGDGDCKNRAAWYVEFHEFGRCQIGVATRDPDVNPDGDRAGYLCDLCLEAAVKAAKKFLTKLPDRAVCPQMPVAHGCGRPISRVEDLIPVKRPL